MKPVAPIATVERGFAIRGRIGGRAFYETNDHGDWTLSGDARSAEIFASPAEAAECIDRNGLAAVEVVSIFRTVVAQVDGAVAVAGTGNTVAPMAQPLPTVEGAIQPIRRRQPDCRRIAEEKPADLRS